MGMGITDHIHNVIFQSFSNLRAQEGSNIPKSVPAGASLAPTLEQRVLVPNPQPITISKAFDLPGSSAFAPLPKVQGPVETPLRKISLRTLFCVVSICNRFMHQNIPRILLEREYVRMQSRNQVGEHQNLNFLPHLSATMYSPVSVCSSYKSNATRT